MEGPQSGVYQTRASLIPEIATFFIGGDQFNLGRGGCTQTQLCRSGNLLLGEYFGLHYLSVATEMFQDSQTDRIDRNSVCRSKKNVALGPFAGHGATVHKRLCSIKDNKIRFEGGIDFGNHFSLVV